MKTFIAIPSMDTLPALFCQSLALLKCESNTIIGFEVGSLVYNARNSLARQAIKSEVDQVLWLDSDMVFGPDLLQRMTKVRQDNNIDMLTAICFRRKPPYTPCLFDRLERLDNGKVSYTSIMSVPDGIFKVGGCGMAGVLMGLDVLISVAAKFDGKMFDPLPGMGEDVSFCWRARQCGYDIYCDTSIELGHVGQCVVTRGYFDAFNDIGGQKDDAGRNKAEAEDPDAGI